jgi:hypothetical protein
MQIVLAAFCSRTASTLARESLLRIAREHLQGGLEEEN